MSRSTWIPASSDDGTSGYSIMTCIQVGPWLYTFVAMPPEPDGISNRRIETTTPDGETLPWRVYSGTGAEAGEIAYTRGKPPPEGTDELTVRVFQGDDLVATAQLRRI